MNYTTSDEKQDALLNDEERERRDEETAPKHKAPFMPDPSDDSPLGSTDQHSDA